MKTFRNILVLMVVSLLMGCLPTARERAAGRKDLIFKHPRNPIVMFGTPWRGHYRHDIVPHIVRGVTRYTLTGYRVIRGEDIIRDMKYETLSAISLTTGRRTERPDTPELFLSIEEVEILKNWISGLGGNAIIIDEWGFKDSTAMILGTDRRRILEGRVVLLEQEIKPFADTPLKRAANYGLTNIAKTLIKEGADVNVKNRIGMTALMFAAWKGHTETLKALLDAGADMNAKDENGTTVLMWAAMRGRTETAKVLIDAGADVNVKGKSGLTALMFASREGHPDTVILLKEHGAYR